MDDRVKVEEAAIQATAKAIRADLMTIRFDDADLLSARLSGHEIDLLAERAARAAFALRASDTGRSEAEAKAWPNGCIKPGSCGRQGACMYAMSAEKCRHHGKFLAVGPALHPPAGQGENENGAGGSP